MSHVVGYDLQIRDLEVFEQCCKANGWKFNRNQKTYKYYGRWMDDSPVPRLLFSTEEEYEKVLSMSSEDRKTYMDNILGKCSHSITIPGCRYEVGLIQQEDYYVPIWDWYDSQLRTILGSGENFPLAQNYATEVVKKSLTQQGLSYTCDFNKGLMVIETY